MNSVSQKHQAVRFFSPQTHLLSKKSLTFVNVSLKSIPCEGDRDNFLRIINGSV